VENGKTLGHRWKNVTDAVDGLHSMGLVHKVLGARKNDNVAGELESKDTS